MQGKGAAIKKGGDNQAGYHLPGWGGVLLGKLNKSKLNNTFRASKNFNWYRNQPHPTGEGIAHAVRRVNKQIDFLPF